MENVQINPQGVSQAQIVISIPTNDGESNLVGTTTAVDKGLVEFFESRTSAIINCDCSKNCVMKDVFLDVETAIPRIYLGTDNSLGEGTAIRYSVQKALELNAEILLIIDPNIVNIQPIWIKKLIEPLEKNFQFVTPLYVHHKNEDLLDNIIAYPLTRALYGWRVKRPLCKEMGFRRELLERIFDKEISNPYLDRDGLSVYLSTMAMFYRVPMCQSVMGQPKKTFHDIEDTFTSSFKSVVGSAFSIMDQLKKYWQIVKWSKPIAIFGLEIDEIEPPREIKIDAGKFHEKFLSGFRKFEEFWGGIISQATFNKLQEIRNLGMDHFNFPAQTWSRVVYDFALAFQGKNRNQQERLLESLLSLFYGKALSYTKRTERMSVQQADDCIEAECMVFEENKPYLISKWKELNS